MKNQIRFLRFPGIAVLPIFAIFFAGAIALGQTLEEQFQTADAELNRVYKELRAKLNDEQKAELKKSQLAWIKEKEFLSKNAKSESEKFTILEKITAQRTIHLLSLLDNKTSIIETKKSNNIRKNENVRNTFLLKSGEQDYPLADYAPAEEWLRAKHQELPDCDLAKLLGLQPQRDDATQVRAEVNAGNAAPVVSASINDAAGVFVTGTRDGEVITWEPNSRRPIARFSIGMQLGGLELQNNGYIVCIGGDYKSFEQKLKVFDCYTGRQIGTTLATQIGGNYANAYRPSSVLTKRNLVLGINTDNTISLTPLSEFVPESTHGRDGYAPSHLVIPSPNLAQGEQILHCWIPEGGRQLAVLSEKLKEPVSATSLTPWDNVAVAEGFKGTVNLLDLETGLWASNVSSGTPKTPKMRIMAEVNGKAVCAEANNEKSKNIVFFKNKDGSVHELCLGIDTPRIFFDSASQFLTSGDCMFNLANFTAQSAPFLRRPYQWLIEKNRRFGWASFVSIEYGKRLVSYERINLSTHSVNACIPQSELFSGVFALTSGEWSVVDASGAMFSSNGSSFDTRKLGFEPLTVSVSDNSNTLAFGGHFEAVVFTPNKMRNFSQEELSEMNVYPDFVSVSPNGERIAFAGNHRSNGSGLIYNAQKDACLVVRDGTIIAPLGAMWISDEVVAFVGDSAFELFDTQTAQRLFSYDTGEITNDVWSNAYRFSYPWRWAVDQSNQRLFYQRRNGFIDIIQTANRTMPALVASLFIVNSQKWALLTPDNYYMVTAKLNDAMHFVVGSQHVLPFEQFDLRLNRPDVILERLGAPDEAISIAKQLRERRLKRMGVTEEMLQPDFHLPEIEIVGDLPSSTADSELALKIKASDSKYLLDRLRVYVNNVPVNGKEGELLRDAKSQTLERTIPIKLAAGRNKIQVSVLNSVGAESRYANAEISCTASRSKPTLYAVAIGVSEYANPEWNLKYAAKDAADILARIRSKSGSSYGEVKELLLTDREVTKEKLAKVREFLSRATVDDTVLMFVAGHGLLDSKYDYYFGTSDIDFENPSGKGIAFEEFDDLLADLPCLKKSLLIDTCHAGELDEEEKKMLASAQANPNKVVAMLPAGARGMNIKPIEGARGKSEWYDRLQGLFVDLRRGSGSTILSSSAGAEYALESSEQKNGIFTYAVLEALDGKEGVDANKDSSVTMSELADYVKTRVAALTNNKQSPNVRRVNLEGDFALAKQ